MKRKRVVMARLTERGQDDRSFDIEFWQKIGTEGIWNAMWEMTREVDLLRGGDGRQPHRGETKVNQTPSPKRGKNRNLVNDPNVDRFV